MPSTRRTFLCLSVLLALVINQPVAALAQATPSSARTSEPISPKPPSKDIIALFSAADKGDTAKVQALLDKGVSASAQAPNGTTPLILATMMNHPDTVKLLLDRGADVNSALVFSGRISGSTALIMASSPFMCIMAGAKTPAEPKGYSNHEAEFIKHHPEQFRQWKEQMQLWSKGYAVIVRLLLDHGANVNAQTMTGTTAIDNAANSGEFDTVRLLLDKGARLDLPTHEIDPLDGRSIDRTNGYEALVGATSMDQHSPEVVALLLAHGAKPNAKSTDDLTPLGRASESGDVQVAEMLLNAGAVVNAYDGFGHTALMLAQRTKHADVVIVLEKAGAKDLPEGPHTEVTLQQVGREPNGDTKMQVIVTPQPSGKPMGKK